MPEEPKPPKPYPLEPYIEIIKGVVNGLGLNADECYNKEGNYWSLRKGSAEIFVTLFVIGEGDGREWYVEFSSPVMKLPSTNLIPFYRRLLEENAKWVATRFSLRGDTVWLDITREVAGIDAEECSRSLTRIGDVADGLDDMLMEEFGGAGEEENAQAEGAAPA
jgi:hypothetical protein